MTGKTAVITGAGQGIGQAIALKLAGMGIHTILVGRTKTKLEQVAADIGALGGTATIFPMDITDHEQINDLAGHLAGKPLDALINCAGESLIKPIEECTAEDWERIFAVIARAPFFLTRALLPNMRLSENASIINIGSKAATGGFRGVTVYGAAKHALLGFTRALADELRESEIRAVMLSPGPADTPMRWAATPDYDPKYLIQPQSVADAVALLLSLPRGTTVTEFLLQSIHFP